MAGAARGAFGVAAATPSTATPRKWLDVATSPTVSAKLWVDGDVLYMHNTYNLRLSIDSMWRQATGISHTELVNHVLGGSWVKWGLSAKAVCSRCNGKDGEPVEISLWSLPDFTTSFDVGMHSNIHPKELITFHITPKCSSTRSHIKSKIVFRVSTIPGIRTLTSNAISLCSRARYHDNQRSEGTNKFLLASCTSPPPASPLLLHFHLELLPSLKRTATPEEFHFNHNKTENCITPTTDHTKGTMELVSLKTTSSRQYIVDSRSNPKLPESTIAGIPERILRRPAIFVSIMSIREEHFITLFKALCELQSSLGFTFHHGKISSNMFLLAAIHNSVENFCYCSEVRSGFISGNNPFHIDFSQPNPILKFVGWANNTFSQTTQFF